MKKIILSIATICCTGWAAKAELPERLWGAGVSYGPNIEKPGLHLRTFNYYTPKIRVGAELNFYLPYHHPNRLPVTDYLADGIVNANYLIPVSSKLTFYPTAGIHIKYGITKNRILPPNETNTISLYTGLNAGAGVQYQVGEKGYLFAEWKYSSIREFNRYVPTIGYMWHTKSN